MVVYGRLDAVYDWVAVYGRVDAVGGDESSFPGLSGEQKIIATFLPDLLPAPSYILHMCNHKVCEPYILRKDLASKYLKQYTQQENVLAIALTIARLQTVLHLLCDK